MPKSKPGSVIYPEIYVDLLLWTLRWYHDYTEKVMANIGDQVALRKVVAGCSEDLDRLHEKYRR